MPSPCHRSSYVSDSIPLIVFVILRISEHQFLPTPFSCAATSPTHKESGSVFLPLPCHIWTRRQVGVEQNDLRTAIPSLSRCLCLSLALKVQMCLRGGGSHGVSWLQDWGQSGSQILLSFYHLYIFPLLWELKIKPRDQQQR